MLSQSPVSPCSTPQLYQQYSAPSTFYRILFSQERNWQHTFTGWKSSENMGCISGSGKASVSTRRPEAAMDRSDQYAQRTGGMTGAAYSSRLRGVAQHGTALEVKKVAAAVVLAAEDRRRRRCDNDGTFGAGCGLKAAAGEFEVASG